MGEHPSVFACCAVLKHMYVVSSSLGWPGQLLTGLGTEALFCHIELCPIKSEVPSHSMRTALDPLSHWDPVLVKVSVGELEF